MSDSYRVKNASGGHDLTGPGWREMARMQGELAELTSKVADALEIYGRESAPFRQARARWADQNRRMMEFAGAGQLFVVVTTTIPKKGRN